MLVIPVLPLLAGRWEPLPLWVTGGIGDTQMTSFVASSLTGSFVGPAGVIETADTLVSLALIGRGGDVASVPTLAS